MKRIKRQNERQRGNCGIIRKGEKERSIKREREIARVQMIRRSECSVVWRILRHLALQVLKGSVTGNQGQAIELSRRPSCRLCFSMVEEPCLSIQTTHRNERMEKAMICWMCRVIHSANELRAILGIIPSLSLSLEAVRAPHEKGLFLLLKTGNTLTVKWAEEAQLAAP